MHDIERELIKATGYKTQRTFTNRQDYLGSILNSVIKLSNDDFDNLTDEAATWANSAIEAKNAKQQDLPDFDEVSEEGEPDDGDAVDTDEGDVDTTDGVPETAPVDHAEAPKKPAKIKKPKPSYKLPDHEDDVVLDKWGCMEGSKNAQALAMFEKGATAKEVKAAVGGTYYNILGKCKQKGHKLEKEGSLIKLTHSSDIGKIKPPATKKAKGK